MPLTRLDNRKVDPPPRRRKRLSPAAAAAAAAEALAKEEAAKWHAAALAAELKLVDEAVAGRRQQLEADHRQMRAREQRCLRELQDALDAVSVATDPDAAALQERALLGTNRLAQLEDEWSQLLGDPACAAAVDARERVDVLSKRCAVFRERLARAPRETGRELHSGLRDLRERHAALAAAHAAALEASRIAGLDQAAGLDALDRRADDLAALVGAAHGGLQSLVASEEAVLADEAVAHNRRVDELQKATAVLVERRRGQQWELEQLALSSQGSIEEQQAQLHRLEQEVAEHKRDAAEAAEKLAALKKEAAAKTSELQELRAEAQHSAAERRRQPAKGDAAAAAAAAERARARAAAAAAAPPPTGGGAKLSAAQQARLDALKSKHGNYADNLKAQAAGGGPQPAPRR